MIWSILAGFPSSTHRWRQTISSCLQMSIQRMVGSTSSKNQIAVKCPAVSNLLWPRSTSFFSTKLRHLPGPPPAGSHPEASRIPPHRHFWWLGVQMIPIHPVLAVLGYYSGILLWNIMGWVKKKRWHNLKVNWTNFAMYLPALLFTGGTMFWFAATVWDGIARLRTPAIAPLPAAEMLGASTCPELSDRRPSRYWMASLPTFGRFCYVQMYANVTIHGWFGAGI